MKKVNYHGWNCYHLENGVYELFVTADAGPRIVHFGLKGEENVFKVFDEEVGEIVINDWHVYGGHRLWHAPEAIPRSYIPDNSPPSVKQTGKIVTFTQDTEAETGLQKEIEIDLEPDSDQIVITHRLINHNMWDIRTAVWALSMMGAGGQNILPLPPRGRHEDNDIDPCNTITMWPFTDFTDDRWYLGKKYFMLRNTPGKGEGQKIGLSVPAEWSACAVNGDLFIKRFFYDPMAEYPDRGCNVEVFTNPVILELETLGPLKNISPGEAIEHQEVWQIVQDVPCPTNDQEIDEFVLPHLIKKSSN